MGFFGAFLPFFGGSLCFWKRKGARDKVGEACKGTALAHWNVATTPCLMHVDWQRADGMISRNAA